METREGDELPAVAHLSEAGDVRLLFGAGHGGFPVEGWGEVVGQPWGGLSVLRCQSHFGEKGGGEGVFKGGSIG